MLSDGEIVFHADYAEVRLATQVNLERVLATSCLVFDDLSLTGTTIVMMESSARRSFNLAQKRETIDGT